MPQRKKSYIPLLLLLLILAAVIWFRYQLLMSFQNNRLKTWKESGIAVKKLWAHRVNSLQRFIITGKAFRGFETDLYYDEDQHSIRVYHPPLQPNDEDSLDIIRFLSFADLNKDRFHFDFRGVNASNANKVIQILDSIKTYIPDLSKQIFELYELASAAMMADKGYPTCLNIDEAVLEGHVELPEIPENIHYISQDISKLKKLKEKFQGKKIITWKLNYASWIKGDYIELTKDPDIEIILVNYKTPYYR